MNHEDYEKAANYWKEKDADKLYFLMRLICNLSKLQIDI